MTRPTDEALDVLRKVWSAEANTTAEIDEFENSQGIHLPAALKHLFTRRGIAAAVDASHSNSNRLVRPGDESILRRGLRQLGLDGDYALVVLIPHQATYEWAAVFDDNEKDARIYVHDSRDDDNEDSGNESWLLTAPSVAMFFWDMAQLGLNWYDDTKHEGGKPISPTDIGVRLDVPTWPSRVRRFWSGRGNRP